MTELLPNIFAIEVAIFCKKAIIKDQKVHVYDEEDIELRGPYDLPPGSYEIMFTTKGVLQEQAVGVVERLTEQVLSITHVLGYKAYNNEKIWKNGYLSNYPFKTATESLQSLLKSKGLTAGNYLIIKKC